jgi:hypothetical protein
MRWVENNFVIIVSAMIWGGVGGGGNFKGGILFHIKRFHYILESNLEGIMSADTTSSESLLQVAVYPFIMSIIS